MKSDFVTINPPIGWKIANFAPRFLGGQTIWWDPKKPGCPNQNILPSKIINE